MVVEGRWAGVCVADRRGLRQYAADRDAVTAPLVALAPADGRLLWEIPFATDYEQNSVTPVAVGDLLIYGGLNKPTTAVRPTLAAGKWALTPVWQNADVPMYMSSPVESGGYLFGLTQRSRGQFFCLDVSTGKTMWTSKGREGENASLMVAGSAAEKTSGSLVMSMTTDGVLVIMRGDAKAFDVLKRYTLAESAVWAHPALVGAGIIVKDVDSLAYWTFVSARKRAAAGSRKTHDREESANGASLPTDTHGLSV